MGLVDLLRASQREGLVRLERDRRGGLRMFRGPALQQTGPSPAIDPSQEMTEAEPEDGRSDTLDAQPVEADDRFEPEEQAEENRFNVEPIPTDTPAEPLDSTEPRRPRNVARGPRKATSKKPPARATKRSKKPAGSESRSKNKV